MEQSQRAASKSERDGGGPTLREQVQTRWSKFNGGGASPNEMEQIQRLGSKSRRDGASSTFGEQVRTRWSKFNDWGANLNGMEQFHSSVKLFYLLLYEYTFHSLLMCYVYS